ncbi:MAG TPA: zinc-ribbon domain containing protein [Blastocatellia bacterium]|nr:zinc-ribbon domain containing protein [Blastocatellia bacterium]
MKARRAKRQAKRGSPEPAGRQSERPVGTVPVNVDLLALCNSYGVPAFVARGYYVDIPFRCQGCGKEEIWTATRQKWWYEVAKGYVYSTAKLCRSCRRRERERREEARRVHLEGVARKAGTDS